MRKDRIIQLADEIEYCNEFTYDEWEQNLRHVPNLSAFNMQHVFYDEECNTPSCIAGHTIALFGDQVSVRHLDDIQMLVVAANLLGLTTEEKDMLFTPEYKYAHFSQEFADHEDFITAKDAVKTLRNFAETGQINWSNE